MVLRCVVVDCGGVTHPDSGLKEAVRRRVPSEISDDAAKAAKAAWNAVKENPAVTKDSFWQMVCESSGLDPSSVKEADADICGTLRSHYSETLEVLKIARDEGIVLGVISNHLGFWFHEECAAPCGLRDLVAPELLLVSSEVGCSKPGNRIFELFLERLHTQHPGLTAADCIFVDDKVENVTAARALGFQGLCFNAKTAAPGALAEDLKKAGVPLP
ncbi:yihX [Symbiodinium necroappetens]|uniref:YihX protein n=1 Tax=Symbiodinium necroappetens TaxID=1628268 RepID=A0A812NK98_9DINO|nr:yihX [Symbiodinium necroappetens]